MTTATRQRRLFRMLIGVAAAMFGFGYVLPPLYAKVCQLTGFNRLQSADSVSDAQPDSKRTVLMQFDSNLRDGLPWKFRTRSATTRNTPSAARRLPAMRPQVQLPTCASSNASAFRFRRLPRM